MAKRRAAQKQTQETQVEETSQTQETLVANENTTVETADVPDQPEYEQREANPRTWANNNRVGVRLQSRREPYQSELVFADRPTQEVLDYIKQEGFRWNGQEKLWVRPDNFATQAQDRLTATRTFYKVVDMLCASKGLEVEGERTVF